MVNEHVGEQVCVTAGGDIHSGRDLVVVVVVVWYKVEGGGIQAKSGRFRCVPSVENPVRLPVCLHLLSFFARPFISKLFMVWSSRMFPPNLYPSPLQL